MSNQAVGRGHPQPSACHWGLGDGAVIMPASQTWSVTFCYRHGTDLWPGLTNRTFSTVCLTLFIKIEVMWHCVTLFIRIEVIWLCMKLFILFIRIEVVWLCVTLFIGIDFIWLCLILFIRIDFIWLCMRLFIRIEVIWLWFAAWTSLKEFVTHINNIIDEIYETFMLIYFCSIVSRFGMYFTDTRS